MHTHFSDWYREASIDPSNHPLVARWAGVERAAAEGGETERLASLLSWAFRVDPEPASPGWLRECFKADDEAFAMRGNDQEMAVLAGAALVHLLEVPDCSSLPALCTANAVFLLGDPLVADLRLAASKWIEERAQSCRSIPKPPKQIRLEQWTKAKDTIAELEQLTVPAQLPSLASKVGQLFLAADGAFDQLRSGANAIAKYSSAVSLIRGEEVELYWWVLRHTSHSQATEGTAQLIVRLADELSSVTNFDVEHPAALEFIQHALGEAAEVQVSYGDLQDSLRQAVPLAPPPFQVAPILSLIHVGSMPASFAPQYGPRSSRTFRADELTLALHREMLATSQWQS